MSALVLLAGTSPLARAADTATGRGWEQVTPADRDYSFGQSQLEQAAASVDGNRVNYGMYGPLPGASAGTLENFNLGSRTAGGWAYKPLAPPQDPLAGQTAYPQTLGFSTDGERSIVMTGNPIQTPDATPDAGNLYLHDARDDSYKLISVGPTTTGFGTFAAPGGASSDWSHIVFESHDQLVPSAPPTGTNSVYDWHNGVLSEVAVYPDGTSASGGVIGRGVGGGQRTAHAVSRDGSHVVFFDTIADLYSRIDDTSTVLVSGSQKTIEDPVGAYPVTYQGASADGHKVFFTTLKELTDDAQTGDDGSGNQTYAGNDLYMYDLDTSRLTDLTIDTEPADLSTGAAVQGMLGNSDDGLTVYFVALGNLASGATYGVPNLYVLHNGVTRFIGTVDPGDASNWSLTQSGPSGITSRITADGRFLVFQSVARLTSYDNTDAFGTPQDEVYRYALDDGTLTCLSCRADGARPSGGSTITPPDFLLNMTRNVTDDGSRVFFDSTDAIVPGDTNGRKDVYEWANGAAQLVSDGTGHYDSTFQDASADGSDVFFATRDQLVAQDTDLLTDVYDARIGGGFPKPAVSLPPCVDEGCQPAATPAAPAPVAATVTFFGPANALDATGSASSKHVTVTRPKAVTGTMLSLKIKVPGKGSISVSGAGLKTARRSAAKAQTVTLRVRLTKAAVASLKHHSKKTIRARVTYRPATGASSTASVTLTFKTTKKGHA